jgi:hypothetical protein
MITVEGQVARQLIAKMSPHRKVEDVLVQAVQVDDDFVVVQDADDAPIKGTLTARKGCYLVSPKPGILYPVSEETFRRLYQPLSEEQTDG